MFKIIKSIFTSGSLLSSISKVVLVTTVSITSVTASGFIIDSISSPNTEENKSTLFTYEIKSSINEVEDEMETSASKSNSEESNGLDEFISDIVTGATKLVEGVLGTSNSGYLADTTTSSSKQSSSTTISTTPISNEDTTTGSSRKNETGSVDLIYHDDDYDDNDQYEDHDEEYEHDEDEEDDDEHEDREDHEDDEDDE